MTRDNVYAGSISSTHDEDPKSPSHEVLVLGPAQEDSTSPPSPMTAACTKPSVSRAPNKKRKAQMKTSPTLAHALVVLQNSRQKSK